MALKSISGAPFEVFRALWAQGGLGPGPWAETELDMLRKEHFWPPACPGSDLAAGLRSKAVLEKL